MFESTDRGTNTQPEIRRSTLAQESVYALAMIYNIQGLSSLVYDLASKDAASFSSMYAAREKIARTGLKKLAEDLAG